MAEQIKPLKLYLGLKQELGFESPFLKTRQEMKENGIEEESGSSGFIARSFDKYAVEIAYYKANLQDEPSWQERLALLDLPLTYLIDTRNLPAVITFARDERIQEILKKQGFIPLEKRV